jgi:preprotein translocase subunit SecE
MVQQDSKSFNIQSKMLWLIGLSLLAAAVWGNSFYSYIGLLYRVIGVLLVMGVALTVISFTSFGSSAYSLIMQSTVEIRKVVWPNRTETTQTTFIVAAAVIAASLILWGLDSLFGWATAALLG